MSIIKIIVLIFATLGALDRLFGNRLGLGREFERAFILFCPMSLSMIGMLTLAPAVGVWLSPVFDGFYNLFGLDPSIISASILGNDMGGVTLATQIAKSPEIGAFNAFIVSSMMGCVISYTLPVALGMVDKSRHNELFLGLLCGVVTIPLGCFVSGIICGIKIIPLILNLLPLIILALVMGFFLVFFQEICIKVFSTFGFIIKAIATVGFICAVFTFLSKIRIYEHFDTFENAAMVCVNACVTLSGMLPLIYILSLAFKKPISKMSEKIGIDGASGLYLISSIVTSTPAFGDMHNMNKKGAVLVSAFAVSASFTLGGHLAFTMVYNDSYVAPMIIGKLVSGIFAIALALLIYKDKTAVNE